MGSAAIRREDRRMGSRATAWRGSAGEGTLVGERFASLGLVLGLFIFFVGALTVFGLTFAVQLFTRPEHVGDALLSKACCGDLSPDVDIDLDVLVVALERSAKIGRAHV